MKAILPLLVAFTSVFAIAPSHELFKKYPNQVFVETGTHLGDGVVQADKAGFNTIHSIEIFPEAYKIVQAKFKE